MLSSYSAGQTGEPIDGEDRRFIRQLTRWLDAGGPPAPPVAETLARLPRAPRPPRLSWSDARARTKARKDAIDAARSQSPGKNLDQLRELVSVEYARRNSDAAPSTVALDAEMLQLEQQSFGRARSALKAIRMLTTGGADAIRLIRNATQHDPDWLRPPDRASYPVPTSRDRYVSVELDAATRDWLARIATEAPRRVGPVVLVDVWLSLDQQATQLVAHIGDHRVGTIKTADADAFDQVMRAAELFDEDPYFPGRLTHAGEPGPLALEIPLPEYAS